MFLCFVFFLGEREIFCFHVFFKSFVHVVMVFMFFFFFSKVFLWVACFFLPLFFIRVGFLCVQQFFFAPCVYCGPVCFFKGLDGFVIVV